MTVTIYGIKNCDTMKKAFSWLNDRRIAYDFHDYRASGIGAETIAAWTTTLGWEKVLNRASTTFKDLPATAKADLDADKAMALMAANPTMIKRPILAARGTVTAGFKPDIYDRLFSE